MRPQTISLFALAALPMMLAGCPQDLPEPRGGRTGPGALGDPSVDDVDDVGDDNPDAPVDEEDTPTDVCTDTPNKPTIPFSSVYYGTTQPTHVPLTAGQIQAIGTFGGCSGTFITNEWVLTADHCGLSTGDSFCIGTQASNPDVCFDLDEVHSHPQGDMTLAKVNGSAAAGLPGTQPIPIFLGSLTDYEGQTAEAAGYGQQEDGGYGEREFTAEPIADVSGDEVTINGQGSRGVCFGDSGGPVMVIAEDGTTRVAGALSWGDPDCLGMDRYTRIDSYRDWVLSFIGEVPDPVPPPAPECNGAATTFGSCNGDTLSWCAGDTVVERPCASCGGEVCGLLDASRGYACLEPACREVPAGGYCDGSVLTSCATGVRASNDCAAAGSICDLSADGGASCLAPTDCGNLDYLGRCDGDTAVWCNQHDQRQKLDCTAQGKSCGYVDSDYGFYCR